MIADAVRQYLDERSVHYQVRCHPERFTARQTAEVAQVPERRFAKVVLLRSRPCRGPAYVMAVVPAHEKVDVGELQTRMGCPVELASEGEVQRVFPAFEIGAAPPLRALAAQDLQFVLDECLTESDTIAFSGGTHRAVVEMPLREFLRLTSPPIIDLGRPIGSPGRRS